MEVITRKQALENGLDTYFTGNPCRSGHISPRSTKCRNCIECQKVLYLEKRPEILERCRIYREENKIERIIKAREYRKKNREKLSAYNKNWQKENRERARAICISRRAKIKGASVLSSNKEISQWALSQDKKCYWCKVNCEDFYHLDHYMPLALGGEHSIQNLVISCADCNSRKGYKHPDVFKKIIGM